MKENYNLNELAMMTGLTTRTLRNHLSCGLLTGEKVDGAWQFTLEQIQDFFSREPVKRSLSAHRSGAVYDFLADTWKKQNRACVVLDFAVDEAEAQAISAFFCEAITRDGEDIRFQFGREGRVARVVLSGGEDSVMDLLSRYYRWKAEPSDAAE